jgi:Arc/MetJ-type ribon-helix-helix transcriptional regulator
MPTSVRLSRELESRLAAYCAQHGVSKTEVIERGLELLLELDDETGKHPAFVAYQRIAARLRPEPRRRRRPSSSDAMRRALRAKYPG